MPAWSRTQGHWGEQPRKRRCSRPVLTREDTSVVSEKGNLDIPPSSEPQGLAGGCQPLWSDHGCFRNAPGTVSLPVYGSSDLLLKRQRRAGKRTNQTRRQPAPLLPMQPLTGAATNPHPSPVPCPAGLQPRDQHWLPHPYLDSPDRHGVTDTATPTPGHADGPHRGSLGSGTAHLCCGSSPSSVLESVIK